MSSLIEENEMIPVWPLQMSANNDAVFIPDLMGGAEDRSTKQDVLHTTSIQQQRQSAQSEGGNTLVPSG